jgi:hypothetical protein
MEILKPLPPILIVQYLRILEILSIYINRNVLYMRFNKPVTWLTGLFFDKSPELGDIR